MSESSDTPEAFNYFLHPGYIFVASKPTVISLVLGSCVSVCLYDRRRKTGGMNHFIYPFTADKAKATARYGNVSTLALIQMMLEDGSEHEDIQAQILGGAYNPEFSAKNIGIENVMIARKVLSRKRISVVSEDTGGWLGRKIVFNTQSNELAIIKVEKLRNDDWYS